MTVVQFPGRRPARRHPGSTGAFHWKDLHRPDSAQPVERGDRHEGQSQCCPAKNESPAGAKDSADHKMAERTQIQLKAATHIFSRNPCLS
jgi:hypothetical protein